MAKIVLVGAGGVIFAQNFMKDILLDPVLRNNQLTLMDINAERLENSATICGLIASILNLDFHPEQTTDLRKALTGADYVITTPSAPAECSADSVPSRTCLKSLIQWRKYVPEPTF